MSIGLKLQTYRRLGLVNLARVSLYRLGLRTGWHPVQRIKGEIGGKDFFGPPPALTDLPAPSTWREESLGFGWHRTPLQGGIPDWHVNPFDGTRCSGADQPWWTLSDFDLPVGDVKTVWEFSRLDWVLAMAQRAAAGETGELARLNAWLADWCEQNPAYLGVNWKCGQGASIRVLHLALAARLLGQDAHPSADLTRLVAAHLARIRPTVSYAMAQDNNHGTSEAAALFVGGGLCAAGGVEAGEGWAREGRRLLENRARRLIAPDGGFSQYSLNYHRLMLDTLSVAELWRGWRDLPAFTHTFRERARAAGLWLYHLVDPPTGDAPNLGPNDGANLLPLTEADYRDHRPSVQLALALFSDRAAYPADGPHHPHLAWLQVPPPAEPAAPPGSRNFSDGGYAVLRRGFWTVLLRYPRYRFRPNHCDALHLDLWHEARNVLRDAGSFGYNSGAPWDTYFPGTAAHNTVAFDDHEQMPAVGRFLRGAWLTADGVTFEPGAAGTGSMAAGYTDWRGCRHVRRVHLDEAGPRVEDRISGFTQRAVLRWRLAPGNWTLSGTTLQGEGLVLNIAADVQIHRLEIVTGWESRSYLQKSEVPVLEIEIRTAGTLTTRMGSV